MKSLFLAMALAVAALVTSANAQYCHPNYCPPSYYQPTYKSYTPSYGPKYYNQWSGWVYGPWAKDPTYFVRYRTFYDHCGVATNHNDGWLYTLDGYGCYHKHCLISAYAVKVSPSPYIDPRGATEVGYYGPEYELVKKYPVALVPGLLQQKDLPGAIDPRSLLAPINSQAEARQAFVEKQHESATSLALKVAAAEQAKELEQIRGRNLLAREIQSQQSDERFLAEFKEMLAVRRQAAVIDANADGARFQVNVNNPKLAQLITTKCASCHGPTKTEGNLNFADAGSFSEKVWRACYRKVATGEMPKGGEPLSDEELDLFDEQYQVALKAR